MYLHWTNDRFIFTEISRLSVAGTLPYINGTHYHHSLSAVDYHSLFISFFSDEEKDVVSVDGTEVYAKSHEEDLTKEGGNGLMPSCLCSLKIHHKSPHKDIQA